MRKIQFKRLFLYVIFFGALFFIDQASKYAAYKSGFASFLNYLRPIFGKQIFPNYNFAFSLKVPLLLAYLIYIFLLGALFYWMYKIKERQNILVIAFFLILVGALSNIYDRITLGYVRDFIFIFWGNIFNLADLYILAGIVLYLKKAK
jgi:signal peptidase II